MPSIEINLLPPQFKPLPPYSLYNIAVILLSAGLLMILVILSMSIDSIKKDYSFQLAGLGEKLNSNREQRKEIVQLQKRATAMKIYLEFLNDIMMQRISWVDKLTDIYHRIPSGLWLNDISMDRKKAEASPKPAPSSDEEGAPPAKPQSAAADRKKAEASPKPAPSSDEEGAPPVKPQSAAAQQVEPKTETILLHISGDAYSMDQIGKFMSNLEESLFFGNTKLVSIVKSESDDISASYISFKVDAELEVFNSLEGDKAAKEKKKTETESGSRSTLTEGVSK